jgi:hypothetical protein
MEHTASAGYSALPARQNARDPGVSSRDENPTEERLIFRVYTPAEWDTIWNFANTSDGKSYVLRRLDLAFINLRLGSRGLPPSEDAKVWTARPPSEEATRWDEIAGAAAHLCSLLDAERTKWAPLVGDMTLALAFYQASRQTTGTPESTEEPRPLIALHGGIAGRDPIRWKIVELRRNICVLAQATHRLARDARKRIGRRGRVPDLISVFIEDLFETFILLKTKIEPQRRPPGFSRGGPLNRFVNACIIPIRRRFSRIPPLNPDQLNARYREWVKRSRLEI